VRNGRQLETTSSDLSIASPIFSAHLVVLPAPKQPSPCINMSCNIVSLPGRLSISRPLKHIGLTTPFKRRYKNNGFDSHMPGTIIGSRPQSSLASLKLYSPTPFEFHHDPGISSLFLLSHSPSPQRLIVVAAISRIAHSGNLKTTRYDFPISSFDILWTHRQMDTSVCG